MASQPVYGLAVGLLVAPFPGSARNVYSFDTPPLLRGVRGHTNNVARGGNEARRSL